MPCFRYLKGFDWETFDLRATTQEVVDRLESGQDPEQIEKEVPGLMEGADGGPMPDLGM